MDGFCLSDPTNPSCSSAAAAYAESSTLASAPPLDAGLSYSSSEDARQLEDLFSASRTAVEASLLAFGAWGRVLLILSKSGSQLAVAAWPSVKRFSIKAAKKFARQKKEAIAVELVALVVFILLWRLVRLFRRRRYISRARAAVRRRLDSFHAGVERRSRALASALPHVGYAAACVVCSRLAERLGLRARLLELMVAALPSLSTGLPAVRTLLGLSSSHPEQQQCLRYWVVWAAAGMCAGLLQAVPFASRIGSACLPLFGRLPILHELPFYFYLWLQLPGRRGLALAFSTIAPEVQRRARVGGALLPALPERVTGALQLVLATALGLERRAAFAEAVHEAGVLAGGLFFLIMPTPIAAVGLLLLALGGPMLRSIEALSEGAGAEGAGGGGGATAAVAASSGAPSPFSAQLRYWLSYAVLCGALRVLQPALRWVPFVTHWQLLAVLWLQLPIFRGATRLLAQLVPPMLRLRAGVRRDASTCLVTDASPARTDAPYHHRLSPASHPDRCLQGATLRRWRESRGQTRSTPRASAARVLHSLRRRLPSSSRWCPPSRPKGKARRLRRREPSLSEGCWLIHTVGSSQAGPGTKTLNDSYFIKTLWRGSRHRVS